MGEVIIFLMMHVHVYLFIELFCSFNGIQEILLLVSLPCSRNAYFLVIDSHGYVCKGVDMEEMFAKEKMKLPA